MKKLLERYISNFLIINLILMNISFSQTELDEDDFNSRSGRTGVLRNESTTQNINGFEEVTWEKLERMISEDGSTITEVTTTRTEVTGGNLGDLFRPNICFPVVDASSVAANKNLKSMSDLNSITQTNFMQRLGEGLVNTINNINYYLDKGFKLVEGQQLRVYASHDSDAATHLIKKGTGFDKAQAVFCTGGKTGAEGNKKLAEMRAKVTKQLLVNLTGLTAAQIKAEWDGKKNKKWVEVTNFAMIKSGGTDTKTYTKRIPTCTENPNQDHCPKSCDIDPNQEKCDISCEKDPKQAKCPKSCDEDNTQPECKVDCSKTPDHPTCPKEDPVVPDPKCTKDPTVSKDNCKPKKCGKGSTCRKILIGLGIAAGVGLAAWGISAIVKNRRNRNKKSNYTPPPAPVPTPPVPVVPPVVPSGDDDDDNSPSPSVAGDDDDDDDYSPGGSSQPSSGGNIVKDVDNQDLSTLPDSQILAIANSGAFNKNPPPGACSKSRWKLGGECSMKKHINYKIKRKIGMVRLLGTKTLLCHYVMKRSPYTVILDKNCED